MLVEKKTSQSQIVAIKLITGEEIIAKLVSYEHGSANLSNPLAMVMAENPDNPTQTRVMFTPWLVAAGKDVIEVREQHIVALAPAREDAKEQYEQAIAT